MMGGSAAAAAAVVPLRAGKRSRTKRRPSGSRPAEGNRSREDVLSRQPLLMGNTHVDEAKRRIRRQGALTGCRRRPGFGFSTAARVPALLGFSAPQARAPPLVCCCRRFGAQGRAGLKIVGAPIEIRRTSARIVRSAAPCDAEVQNASVGYRSRPLSGQPPISRGSHCAKGASVR